MSRAKKNSRFYFLLSKFFIFVLIFAWVFSGWPRVYSLAQESATSTLAESPLPMTLDDFDSYTPGALYGRGTWDKGKSGRDWMVNISRCPSGSISGGGCLVLEPAATAQFENTIDAESSPFLPYSNNIISFSFYPNWSGEPTVVFNLYFLTPGARAEQVRLDFNTSEDNLFYIFLTDGINDAVVFDLPLKQWHKVELNIDKISRQARFRVNGGEWTDFVSWMNSSGEIGLLRLRGMVEGDENFYLDDFSVSEFRP